MSEEVIDTQEQNKNQKLPMFLNVLTILTFIGSGISALSALYNFFTVETQREQIEQSREILEQSGGAFAEIGRGAVKALEYNTELNLTALGVALACIFGALMMRKLKKSGFFIYTAASVIGVAVPLAIFGTGLMGLTILASSIFSIAFIIMYGVNLKYMN